ncbi:UNVERIFIED_CONTAM: hypothetical protein RMT77_019925 [Armadillidium vulgare]
MYNFINALSYTSSIMILVVNCIERYIAIMKPFRAKSILRQKNLVIALLIVWLCSGIYCSPRLLYFRAISHSFPEGHDEVICLADRDMYNSKTFDTISFILLYLLPLTVISVLYLRIARYLWVSGLEIENSYQQEYVSDPFSKTGNCTVHKSYSSNKVFKRSKRSLYNHSDNCNSCIFESSKDEESTPKLRCHRGAPVQSWNSDVEREKQKQRPYHSNDIRRWRKVVKLLVAVVICFAVCNLPFHLRKMLIYYYPGFNAYSNAVLVATPLTQALTYLNSALNPILYCFMSYNFRFCIREVLNCQYNCRGKRRPIKRTATKSQQLSMDSYRFDRKRNMSTVNTSELLRF